MKRIVEQGGDLTLPTAVKWPARPGEAQYDWEPPRTGHGIPNRAARLKAIGNAIVPQCAYVIFRAIQATEEAPNG